MLYSSYSVCKEFHMLLVVWADTGASFWAPVPTELSFVATSDRI